MFHNMAGVLEEEEVKGFSFLNGTRSGLFVSSFSPESCPCCCCCCWMQRGVVVGGGGHSFECRRVNPTLFFSSLKLCGEN